MLSGATVPKEVVLGHLVNGSTDNPATRSPALGVLFAGHRVAKLSTISESSEEVDQGVLTDVENELRKGIKLHRGESISLDDLIRVGTPDETGQI